VKILLTTHQFLPEFSSGTEVLTFELAKGLQKLGHDVSVFTGFPAADDIEDSERFDSYVHKGIPVTRFHHGRVPMGECDNIVEAEYNNQFLATYFRKYLEELEPDLVHFFHLQRLSASAIDVCHDLDIPMVMTPTDFWLVCPMNQLRKPDNSLCTGPDASSINCLKHIVALTQSGLIAILVGMCPTMFLGLAVGAMCRGDKPNSGSLSLVRALTERPAFLKARMNKLDKVVVPTHLMEKMLQDNGLRQEKMLFLPFGINLQYLESAPKVERSEVLRVGFIGTLAEHKGAHVLIEAVRLLSLEKNLDVRLYGKLDDFPNYVEQLKEAVGADRRVRFSGSFPNQNIGEVFSDLDVLVVPSIWYENTPLVIYSAQAAGCPVIASNLGGMAEVVQHENNGLLFEAGDASDLAAKLKLLIDAPDVLGRLADNAKNPKSVTEYATELAEIYDSVIKERQQAI
jgi:glycosyltransferase involved in cell wall biosynthesis